MGAFLIVLCQPKIGYSVSFLDLARQKLREVCFNKLTYILFSMTTVINTPSNGESTSAGFMIGATLVIVIILGLFFVYGLPLLQNEDTPQAVDVNVQLPTQP